MKEKELIIKIELAKAWMNFAYLLFFIGVFLFVNSYFLFEMSYSMDSASIKGVSNVFIYDSQHSTNFTDKWQELAGPLIKSSRDFKTYGFLFTYCALFMPIVSLIFWLIGYHKIKALSNPNKDKWWRRFL